MEKFQEFANLEGSKACNLRKYTDKGLAKIPNSGELKDFINDGDLLYCDLTTNQYWVKTIIKLNSNYRKLTISLDIKFRVENFFNKLKFLLMKLGIDFWMDYAKEAGDSFHYIFNNAKFKTLKSKHNMEFNVTDLSQAQHIGNSR